MGIYHIKEVKNEKRNIYQAVGALYVGGHEDLARRMATAGGDRLGAWQEFLREAQKAKDPGRINYWQKVIFHHQKGTPKDRFGGTPLHTDEKKDLIRRIRAARFTGRVPNALRSDLDVAKELANVARQTILEEQGRVNIQSLRQMVGDFLHDYGIDPGSITSVLPGIRV